MGAFLERSKVNGAGFLGSSFVMTLDLRISQHLSHRDNVAAYQERQLLGDQVGKVHQRRSVGRVASQHQDLGSVVLDMLLGLRQVLDTFEGIDKDLNE